MTTLGTHLSAVLDIADENWPHMDEELAAARSELSLLLECLPVVREAARIAHSTQIARYVRLGEGAQLLIDRIDSLESEGKEEG